MPSDFLHCHYPLPLPEYQKCLFQTPDIIGKNLNFIITTKGRLVRQAWRLEDKSKILYGIIDELYHGVVVFCCVHKQKVITFAAHFWEGQLTKIEVVGGD